MNTLRWITCLACLMPLAALAQAAIEDTNGDGVFSPEEVTAAYPDVTAEKFAEMDANADGALDAQELAAAVAAGMIAG